MAMFNVWVKREEHNANSVKCNWEKSQNSSEQKDTLTNTSSSESD